MVRIFLISLVAYIYVTVSRFHVVFIYMLFISKYTMQTDIRQYDSHFRLYVGCMCRQDRNKEMEIPSRLSKLDRGSHKGTTKQPLSKPKTTHDQARDHAKLPRSTPPSCCIRTLFFQIEMKRKLDAATSFNLGFSMRLMFVKYG